VPRKTTSRNPQAHGHRPTQVSASARHRGARPGEAAGAHSRSAVAGASDPEMPLRTSLRSAAAAGPNLVVLRTDTSAAQPVGLSSTA